jgi:hypothetical protein
LWNNNVLPNIVGTEKIGLVSQSDFVGEFGLFNRRSEAVFGNAHLMLLE